MKKIVVSIVLLGTLFGTNLRVNAQTKIGFNTADAFDVSGNSVAHYGMSQIVGSGYQYVGLSGFFGMNFYTEGKERIKLLRNGNLGIGTATPSEKFEVKGNIKISQNSVSKHSLNFGVKDDYVNDGLNAHIWASSGTAGAFYGEGAHLVFEGRYSNRNMYFKVGQVSSPQHVMTYEGKVGIGTTNPDMKLTVNGKIHAEEVKIDLNIPAPDYVFKEDYNLRSLEDVEEYIRENSHLPEIPSAKEFEQNGVMQAEMDMCLLKKIEELTLYTIQQQKEIEKLKKENDEVLLWNKKLLEIQLRLEKLESVK